MSLFSLEDFHFLRHASFSCRIFSKNKHVEIFKKRFNYIFALVHSSKKIENGENVVSMQVAYLLVFV